ncbi:hypothetical protein M513_04277, partial [Trichuris suis]
LLSLYSRFPPVLKSDLTFLIICPPEELRYIKKGISSSIPKQLMEMKLSKAFVTFRYVNCYFSSSAFGLEDFFVKPRFRSFLLSWSQTSLLLIRNPPVIPAGMCYLTVDYRPRRPPVDSIMTGISQTGLRTSRRDDLLK